MLSFEIGVMRIQNQFHPSKRTNPVAFFSLSLQAHSFHQSLVEHCAQPIPTKPLDKPHFAGRRWESVGGHQLDRAAANLAKRRHRKLANNKRRRRRRRGRRKRGRRCCSDGRKTNGLGGWLGGGQLWIIFSLFYALKWVRKSDG